MKKYKKVRIAYCNYIMSESQIQDFKDKEYTIKVLGDATWTQTIVQSIINKLRNFTMKFLSSDSLSKLVSIHYLDKNGKKCIVARLNPISLFLILIVFIVLNVRMIKDIFIVVKDAYIDIYEGIIDYFNMRKEYRESKKREVK